MIYLWISKIIGFYFLFSFCILIGLLISYSKSGKSDFLFRFLLSSFRLKLSELAIKFIRSDNLLHQIERLLI